MRYKNYTAEDYLDLLASTKNDHEKQNEIVANMVESGINLNYQNYSTKRGFLHEVESPDAAKMLLDNGVDLHQRDVDGQSCLFFANASKVEAVLDWVAKEVSKTYLDLPNHDKEKQIEITKDLNKLRSIIDAQDDFGYTALWFANDSAFKILVEAGADVNIQNIKGNTVVFETSQYSRMDKLLSGFCGADLSIRNNQGETALHYQSDENIIKLMVERGASLMSFDKHNKTVISTLPEGIKQELASQFNIKISSPKHTEHKSVHLTR